MSDIGDVIDGRYRLERSVGSGGMGIVYLATDLQTGKKEAIKVLHATVKTSVDVRARLKREIELLSRLHSPYIAELRATGYLADGSPYFVMEYLEGRDLKAELRLRGPLPYAEAVAYIVQTCRGVAVAHHHEIVHRDLKPHNLIVTGLSSVRTVKIVDFGVAKSLDATDPGLTATNTSVGTPLYMSPEQLLEARAISTKADVWALGVILYELLAGFSPFSDDSPGAVIAAVTLDEPFPIQKLRPDVPDGVARAIGKALLKLPSERLSSVEELEQLLLPYAMADDRLIINETEAQNNSRSIIPRPARNRVSAYLMEKILVSIEAATKEERVTIRCLKAAPKSDSLPLPELLSLVPSLKGLSPALPEMIRSGSVADTNPGLFSRPRRRFGDLKSLILYAAFTLFFLVVVFWQRRAHFLSTKVTALDAPVRGSQGQPKPSATTQIRELHVRVTDNVSTPLNSTTQSPPALPNVTTTNRGQVAVSMVQPNPTRKNVTRGTVTRAAVPATTTTPPSGKMVPSHL